MAGDPLLPAWVLFLLLVVAVSAPTLILRYLKGNRHDE